MISDKQMVRSVHEVARYTDRYTICVMLLQPKKKKHHLTTLATINKEDYIVQYILYLEEASLFWKKMQRHT